MCSTCGCSDDNKGVRMAMPEDVHAHTLPDGTVEYHSHHHHYDHDHHHEHHHQSSDKRIKTIDLEQNILQSNDLTAARNRGYFEAKNVFAINFVSSPGSGKTSLLEKTIREYSGDRKIFVIEGDQETFNDAARIKSAGAPVVQINTGNACHLDAEMINIAVKKLDVSDSSLLLIENVGNLVCPSLFDLGENIRVVISSTTEGEDKPIKYPNMFKTADLCIINKIDLLPYVDFDTKKFKNYALKVNKNIKFIELSVRNNENFDKWLEYLKQN